MPLPFFGVGWTFPTVFWFVILFFFMNVFLLTQSQDEGPLKLPDPRWDLRSVFILLFFATSPASTGILVLGLSQASHGTLS